VGESEAKLGLSPKPSNAGSPGYHLSVETPPRAPGLVARLANHRLRP